jgi:hypothetical protein
MDLDLTQLFVLRIWFKNRQIKLIVVKFMSFFIKLLKLCRIFALQIIFFGSGTHSLLFLSTIQIKFSILFENWRVS